MGPRKPISPSQSPIHVSEEAFGNACPDLLAITAGAGVSTNGTMNHRLGEAGAEGQRSWNVFLLTAAPTWASSIWARWRKNALELARRSSKEVVMPSNETSAARVQTLMTGLAFGESPR